MAGPVQRRQMGRTGNNTLAYMGVEPASPTNYVTFLRDPVSGTSQDYQNWYVGDEWENRTNNNVWKLVSKDGGIATWVLMVGGNGNVTNLIDDSGNVVTPEVTGGIHVTGGLNIYTDNPAPHALSVNLTQGIQAGDILITNTATGEAEWNRITPGAGITVTNAQGHVTISSAGAGGDVTLVGDGGTTATTVAGSVNVLGTAGHITTTGDMAATLTLDTGTDVAVGFLTDDANTAIPAAGVLSVAGAGGITTSSAGSTVTITAPAIIIPSEVCNFKVYLAADIPNVTGDGGGYIIPFDTVWWDIGGDYNIGLSRFIAPLKGVYMLGGVVTLEDPSAATNVGCFTQVEINGGAVETGYQNNVNSRYLINTVVNNYSFTHTQCSFMDAGDNAIFKVSVNKAPHSLVVDIDATGGGADIRTYYYGYLIARLP